MVAFPLDHRVELHLDGVWTDITPDVYQRDPITITRGRSEGGQGEPSRCGLTLNNRSGDYSPRNPTGAYFGVLGRNTPLRGMVNQITSGTNGTFEVDATGWTGSNAAVSRVTSLPAHTGVGTLRIVAASAADMWAGLSATGTSGIPVKEGVTYTLSGWVQAGATGRVCSWRVDWYDAAGAAITSTLGIGSVSDVTTGWTLSQGDATAPATAAYARPRMFVTAPANTEVHYLDDASFGDVRFTGEVSSWPQRWDTSGNDVWVPIEAAGVMRRLGQGQAPLKSTYYRSLTRLSDVVAYWPCEDGEDATELASALPGHTPMRLKGDVDTASFSGFNASGPLPTASEVTWAGTVPSYTSTGAVQTRFLMAVPAGGVTGTPVLCSVRTAGTAKTWNLFVNSSGNMQMQVRDADGALLQDSGVVAVGVNGKLVRVSIELNEIFGDADWEVVILEVGGVDDLAGAAFSSSVGGRTIGRAKAVVMNGGGGLNDVALGHVSVESATAGSRPVNTDELVAYAGETAGRRVERLCSEEGITFASVGDLDDSAALGPQLSKTLLELLREAETADLGILYEPRDALGIAYRTRVSLYAQDPALELDYATADLSSIEPVDDDQATRNDVTVTRDGGAAARAVDEDGPLGTDTDIGRYDEDVTVSVERDEDLPNQASWRLHLGTVDEARYPSLGLNLARSAFTADAVLTAAAVALDVGDKVTVTNPPAWLPPDDINQLAQGMTETLERFEWTVAVVCAPASPWDVGIWNEDAGPGEARYSSDGSELAEDLTTGETAVDVATPAGPLWSDADQPFDINVGGERMTVTAISGSTSPQTFTVTRSVNGVVKTHATGAEVRLWKPAYYAL